MTSTVTANYQSEDQLRNVKDDLLSSGITDEHVKVDEATKRVSVLMPKVTEPTVVELFERHELKAIKTTNT